MSTTQVKIAAKQKQRADILHRIKQLNDAFEEATVAGDTALVRESQAEIAASKAIVTAIDKAIADLWSGTSAEQIAAEQVAIDEDAKFIEKKSEELNHHIAKTLCPAFEAFAAALVKAEAISDDRIKAIRSVVRRIPQEERERYHEYCHPDTLLGAAIEDAMLKAGIFTKIASAPWIHLRRHDLTDIAGCVEKRSDRLMVSVARAAGIARQALRPHKEN